MPLTGPAGRSGCDPLTQAYDNAITRTPVSAFRFRCSVNSSDGTHSTFTWPIVCEHLRGGTRPFGKHWGTAIYGQCDTNLAPDAVRLAYDMGARYVWFWTSDHDHHVPWPEQLALARALKAHAQAHPRSTIFGPPRKLDTAIVIPNGYFLSLESLWWVRMLDKEGTNDASLRYHRLMQRAFAEVRRCWARGEHFDITVDDGRPIKGYRRVVRVDDR